MLRTVIVAMTAAASAHASGFTFTLGSPVAAHDYRAKTAAFVFRTEGCADTAKAEISATAEGLLNGSRRSAPLKVMPMQSSGVYAVYQNWPGEGAWVVNLRGICGNVNAGAIVPIGPKGFIRESAKFFPRPATNAEIETSLKELIQGGNR